ncbi:DUF1574 domain-containing protein [Zobellia sp.]|nr:DUF1574 domain-containing protein [Zobellia sp.]
MQKGFIRTIFKFLKFLIILLIVDLLFGTLAKKVFFGQRTGKQARITYSIKEANSDIFIFGSSHANRHYVPSVIQEELNKSCYNAGVQGQGILFNDALQKIILQRTKPKLIILNIDDIWLYERNDNYDRLADFYPYYWDYRKVLKPVIDLRSKLTDFKLAFKAYQYNSTLVHAIKYMVSPQKNFEGYLPLKGTVVSMPEAQISTEKKKSENHTRTPLDSNFIASYKSFIKTAKDSNIKLILVISPWYLHMNTSDNESMTLLKSIAKIENTPIIDLYNDNRFLDKNELFNDTSHLNDNGAHTFSTIVAEEIKKIYQK